ncbi:cilia- and flagella-associated protein 251-like isoform X2 [Crotalus tigris]|uniref:cilia- and flagella-associated protein 251-like isoform X2 n=1 Tax=Crotalus tigris TaxID=88082 RepID=UPI00192F92AF|nr:cilia- and flagella-associated protein 251-like isoform X2 [Crotalus tigris]
MMSLGVSLRLFFLCPAFSLPVPAQLSKEDETVVKCISEILADALSRSSPMPVTSECMKILREDERVLALLQHRHLLTELEELAHQENAKHLLAHEINHNSGEEQQQGELQKSDGLAQQKEAERAGRKKEDEKEEEEEEEEKEVMKKDEKTKKPQEKIKVSQKEDGQDSLEERDVEEEQEEKETKERTASETWSSKEYFGHVKKRGSRQPQIRKGMLRGEEEGQEREEVGKRRLRMGEEERDDPSEEEEQKKYHPGGHSEDESWEEEEERSTVAKRVAEKASDEETAQFEEEKGLQSSRAHLHKSWKPWKEDAEEEDNDDDKTRHGHHHPLVGLELRKRHGKEEVDPKGRHRAPEEEEEEEEEKDTRQRKAQEVEKLEEIERQLKWAADNLEELKRG